MCPKPVHKTPSIRPTRPPSVLRIRYAPPITVISALHCRCDSSYHHRVYRNQPPNHVIYHKPIASLIKALVHQSQPVHRVSKLHSGNIVHQSWGIIRPSSLDLRHHHSDSFSITQTSTQPSSPGLIPSYPLTLSFLYLPSYISSDLHLLSLPPSTTPLVLKASYFDFFPYSTFFPPPLP
jgi:hypothetical protein